MSRPSGDRAAVGGGFRVTYWLLGRDLMRILYGIRLSAIYRIVHRLCFRDDQTRVGTDEAPTSCGGFGNYYVALLLPARCQHD